MVSTLFFFSAAELAWDWFSMAIAHSLTPHEDETTGGEEEEVPCSQGRIKQIDGPVRVQWQQVRQSLTHGFTHQKARVKSNQLVRLRPAAPPPELQMCVWSCRGLSDASTPTPTPNGAAGLCRSGARFTRRPPHGDHRMETTGRRPPDGDQRPASSTRTVRQGSGGFGPRVETRWFEGTGRERAKCGSPAAPSPA
ncbi:hypothetical protein F2P81_021775 [Scophthalmus maximus]|uniref:Secreted protein n=1 Tax=Scophthalmus maximus TaxID=52904 RepID=A0A6A4S2Y4_SCOMX|nr:hypothetical protein F2P81_021775 [Scophthalmus maximus]